MEKHRWFAVLLLFMFASCSGVQTPVTSPNPLSVIKTPNVEPASTFPSPTKTDIFASTKVVATSTVPQSSTTPSPVSSPTSFPTPSYKGPHLVARLHTPKEGDSFIKGDDIVVFDADGRGQRIIDLPQDSEVLSIPDAVSPDGEWLAYYSGEVQEGNLTLSIISLKDQQKRLVSQVVTPNYEDGLYKIAEKLAKENKKTSQLTAGDWMAEVQNTFLPGMHSLSWSPDSQTLAFAAQIDGPSSDLYLYDVQSSSIRRMIDDIENVYQLQWSPDGKRILLENAIPKEGGYMGIALYIMQEEGSIVKNPHPVISGSWWGTEGWISPKQIIITGHGDGGPPFDIRSLEIDTGRVSHLWKDVYTAYAYDLKNKILAVNAFPSDPKDPNAQYKIMLISQNKQQAIGSIGEVWNDFYYRGGTHSQFVANQDGNIFAISEDGEITKLSNLSIDQVSISPDHCWLVLGNDSALEIYSEADEIVQTITKPGISEVVWRSDSSGFFFYSGKVLYYKSMSNNDPVLLPLITQSGFIDLSSGKWVP